MAFSRMHWIGRAATWTVLLLGPFLGWVTFHAASGFELEKAQSAFDAHISERAALLQKEVFDIAEDLHHIRAFFISRKGVTREDFRIFVREVLESHPSIRALAWVPRIAPQERRGQEARVQLEGFPAYRIHALQTAGPPAPDTERQDRYPVLYVEPFASNEHLFGLDLLSVESMKEALSLAGRSQRIAFTPPLNLASEGGAPEDFFAVLPVYREQADGSSSDAERPDGYVAILLNVGEIVGESLLLGGGQPRMEIQLANTGAEASSVEIFASPGWDALASRAGSVFERSIVLGEQNWRLRGLPTELFLSEHLTALPAALGIGVFLFWETLCGFGLSVSRLVRDQALRKQEHLYGSVWRSLNEGVIVAEPDGRFRLFNESAKKILGLGPRQIDLEEWSSTYGCFHPEDGTVYPSDQLPLARALRGEVVRNAEIFIRNPHLPDGVYINVSGSPLVDDDGASAGGVVVFHDVTPAKKADRALKQSLKELEDVKYALDQAAIVAVTDREGGLIYVNDKFCEISGYAREELLGRNHSIVNSGYHPKSFFDDLWKTISAGRIWRKVIRNRSKSGSHYWVDTTIVPLASEEEKPERYLAIQSDITERRRQQETLERLSNAVEQTADTVFIANREGVIEYVNPAFENTTGYSRGEAVGQTPRIFKSGTYDASFYRELWEKILRGEVYQSTTINRKKSGELFHAEQTITPMRDMDGNVTHFVSVLKDVTERLQARERELEMHYASLVQKKLYPEQSPKIEGFDIAGAVFPAEATCGDYFDFLGMTNGELGIAIGDVCGHGLGPALIMAETRAYVRSLARRCTELNEILSPINDWLHADLEEGSYVTFLVVCVDTVSRKLVWANAGHTPGYLIGRSGEPKAVLQSTGFPLGMFPGSSYERGDNLAMEAGDLLVLITDGIPDSESADGEAFSEKRLLDVVRAHREEPAEQIILHVRRAIYEFTGGAKPNDDLTIVICKAVS